MVLGTCRNAITGTLGAWARACANGAFKCNEASPDGVDVDAQTVAEALCTEDVANLRKIGEREGALLKIAHVRRTKCSLHDLSPTRC